MGRMASIAQRATFSASGPLFPSVKGVKKAAPRAKASIRTINIPNITSLFMPFLLLVLTRYAAFFITTSKPINTTTIVAAQPKFSTSGLNICTG